LLKRGRRFIFNFPPQARVIRLRKFAGTVVEFEIFQLVTKAYALTQQLGARAIVLDIRNGEIGARKLITQFPVLDRSCARRTRAFFYPTA